LSSWASAGSNNKTFTSQLLNTCHSARSLCRMSNILKQLRNAVKYNLNYHQRSNTWADNANPGHIWAVKACIANCALPIQVPSHSLAYLCIAFGSSMRPASYKNITLSAILTRRLRGKSLSFHRIWYSKHLGCNYMFHPSCELVSFGVDSWNASGNMCTADVVYTCAGEKAGTVGFGIPSNIWKDPKRR
jgi:hypothetical protein